MAGLAATFGSGAMTNSIEDLRGADLLLVIGSNTTEQHPLVAERIIDAKKNRGATLIVADPRRTALAAMADLHLPLRPGGDLALITALCRVILDEGLEARDFIRERTENFTDFAASLDGCTADEAGEATGLSPEDIRKAARLYAAGPDSSIVYCMGVTQHNTGTANCMALANLVMLCGMIGRPHTGLNPLRGQNNVQGACDMGALPNVLPGYVPADGNAPERFAALWGDYAGQTGMTLVDMLRAATERKLRGLFVMGENPALSDADTEHVLTALQSLDFLVVQDIFLTETARHAHVVLPAASWLEKEGCFTNTERRVQKVNPVLEPLPGTLPDWQILARLIRLSGHKADYRHPGDILEEIRALVPAYAGITYARLEREAGLCWPCPSEDHLGTPILHVGRFARGKGRFACNLADPACPAPEQPDADYPLVLTTGRLGFHYHTGSMTRRSWVLEREYPENFVEMHPDDARAAGLKEGWRARVSSRRGAVTARVRIRDGIRRGVVFMPFHFTEEPANALTGSGLDPISKTPAFKVSAVRVEEA